jgi:hypothetical protein
MLKPKITILFLLMAFMISLISEVSFAQLKSTKTPQKAWKRPVTYIMPTPRVKAKKYVYQIETREVTRATVGELLPSQVGMTTRKISGDETVSLKEKPKVEVKQRSIASE